MLVDVYEDYRFILRKDAWCKTARVYWRELAFLGLGKRARKSSVFFHKWWCFR